MRNVTFDQLIEALSPEDRRFIMRQIAEASAIREYEGLTARLFQDIGARLWKTACKLEEPKPPQQPTLEPGDRAFYCRQCRAPRAFRRNEYGFYECKVCGRERHFIDPKT